MTKKTKLLLLSTPIAALPIAAIVSCNETTVSDKELDFKSASKILGIEYTPEQIAQGKETLEKQMAILAKQIPNPDSPESKKLISEVKAFMISSTNTILANILKSPKLKELVKIYKDTLDKKSPETLKKLPELLKQTLQSENIYDDYLKPLFDSFRTIFKNIKKISSVSTLVDLTTKSLKKPGIPSLGFENLITDFLNKHKNNLSDELVKLLDKWNDKEKIEASLKLILNNPILSSYLNSTLPAIINDLLNSKH